MNATIPSAENLYIQTLDMPQGRTMFKKDFYWNGGAVSSTLPPVQIFYTFKMNPTFALFDFIFNQNMTKF